MRLTFDHETDLIDRGLLAPPIVCTSWTEDAAPAQLELWTRERMLAALRDPKVAFVGANTAYDVAVEMADYPEFIPLWVCAYLEGRVRDVQLDRKLIDIARGVYERHDPTQGGDGWSLEALAERRGVTMEKDHWRTRYGALKGVPVDYWPPGAIAYSLQDAEETRTEDDFNQAFFAQHAPAMGWIHWAQHCRVAAGAHWALHLASCWGVCTHPARTEGMIERVHAHIEEIKTELKAAGLIRPNGKRNDKAAAQRMIDVMHGKGLRVQLSEGGQKRFAEMLKWRVPPERAYLDICGSLEGIKLDKDAAIQSGDELLIMRADYISSDGLLTRAETMRDGYVTPLQTRFDFPKETFRSSSSKPSGALRGVQMQNFPRGKKEDAYGLRECFTPRSERRVFIGADVSQAELHMLSQVNRRLFGWSRMGDLLNANVDLHWLFAANSIGRSYDELKASGEKKHRDRAKPANFGFPGGMGPDKFIDYSRKGYGEKFERDEVVRLKKVWLDTFPEMRLYLKWIGEQCKDGPFLSIHPITGYARGACEYTEGSNHNFQHLLAYAKACALLELTADCFNPSTPLFGYRLWNEVHDELLFESPEDDGASAPDAAEHLGQKFAAIVNRFCPDYETHADAFITRVWSKRCEQVRGPDGRIAEWKMAA